MARRELWISVLFLVGLVFLVQWITRVHVVASASPPQPLPPQAPATESCDLLSLGPPFSPCLYHFDPARDSVLQPALFPTCAVVSWLPPVPDLFNPVDVWPPRAHHPIVRRFYQYHGPVDRNYMMDWLGVRTAFVHECAGGPAQAFSYMQYVPSRRFQCERHCQLVAGNVRSAPGEMPLFDDEYPEWVDMLSSVERTPRNYIVVELGARLGTWGVRALAAHRQRWGAGNATFLGVESEAPYYRAMQHHTRVNGLAPHSTLLHAFVGAGGLALNDLFKHVDHIDYLDVDIQSSEGALFVNASRERLSANVAHVHVGTHTPALHAQVRSFFEHDLKWRKLLDLPWNQRAVCDSALSNSIQTDRRCLTQTPLGALYVRDGMLAFSNPRLVHRDTVDYSMLTVL